ncbi:ATP-dependent translocase ABCB1-like isoform X2 [Clytia hemisphaerica]|uniref:ABC-type xenobiotic transporter n=1 Tax=Clytia hemisphaerica TaxID=252671 RepID=A0A7M5WWC8_9CNID
MVGVSDVENGGVNSDPPPVVIKNGKSSKLDEAEGSKDEKKEKEAPPAQISFGQLFSYADSVDYLLMTVATIASIGNGIAQPASFVVFGQLIEKFVKFGASPGAFDISDDMKDFAIIYVIIGACMFVCSFFQAGFWSMTSIRQIHKIRLSFFDSILRQDIGWYDVEESGSLTTRLTDDLIKVQAGMGEKIGMALQALAMFFGGFGIGFFYSWELTLVILAVTPALIIVGAIFGKIMGNMSESEQTSYAEAGGIAEEAFSSIRTVVAFCGEQDTIKRYSEKLKDAERAGVKKALLLGGSMGAFHIVIFGCYALAFWHGSQMVADLKINAGELLIVFFCVMIGAAQLGQVGPSFEAISVSRGAAFKVFEIIKRVPTIDCTSDKGTKLESVTGNIQFNDVHFHYPSREEMKILDGFNLTIEEGTTVALVGESGCGKSTCIKLVQRFYDVMQGSVTLDGHDLKTLNVNWLRKNIGVVSQEPVLFDMTITENIKFGAIHQATQNEVEEAAKMANAHDFISKLPNKYNTNVGEGGAQLSGGQKQRIAIARALIRNPKILLFDEATSALDTESEAIVQAALDRASKGRTTIIIAHRLSTVRNADKIVAVKEGKVAEQGKHDVLMAAKGVYHQLVLLQTMVEEVAGELDSEELQNMSEAEKEKAVQAKLMRSLSTLSNESDEGKVLADKFQRQLSSETSIRKSLRNKKESDLAVSPKKSGHSTKEDALKPSEEEEEEEDKPEPAPMGRVMKLNAPEWPYMAVGSFFAALVGAFPVLFAFILSELIEVFANPPEKIREDSKLWALLFLCLGFLDFFGLFFSSYLFGKAGEVLTTRLRTKVFTALLRQNISYFDDPKNGTGHLTARLATDASNVKGATCSRLNIMIQTIVMGITALTIAFYYSWKLTLLILGFGPLLIFAGAAHMKVFTNFAADESSNLIDASAIATEAIMNIRTVASIGKEKYFLAKYEEKLDEPFKKSVRNSNIFGLTFGTSTSLMMLAQAAAFALGGKLVQDGDLVFDDMFKVVLSTVFGAMIAGEIGSMAPDYVAAKVSAARCFQILDLKPEIDSFNNEGKILDNVNGNINFQDVAFNYPNRPDVTVLKSLSFDIKSGQKIALVGSSGCGKSTSIGLLERFYNPKEGRISIDGHEVKSFNLKWLRQQLGLVSQEPVLFARSIRDNIVYGLDRQVSDEEITKVCQNANVHSFIHSLPMGYDTLVGDKGTLISGGQKQRIAIARALIRDPKIMLLDEATSALDSESEKIVQNALDVAMEGRTSIIIAHRLSTIQNSDVICVIQDGGVVEMGTHQELIAKKGAYYNLNQAQL